jgi:hypothetical protein
LPLFPNRFAKVPRDKADGKSGTVEDVQRRTMSTTLDKSAGFAVPADTHAPRYGSALPALIATMSLCVSIAIVLTAAMNAARAAHLF